MRLTQARFAFLGWLLWLSATGSNAAAWARHPAESDGEVDVFLPTLVGSTVKSPLTQALGITSRIYREAGITLRWKRAETGMECSRREGRVVIEFSTGVGSDSHPGALAYARPYAEGGSCVTIFLDRLEPMAASNPAGLAYLLGHVLAHEVAHYLEGIVRHSESGVMKAFWTPQDIQAMMYKPLRFTDDDRDLLELALGFERAHDRHPVRR